MLRRTLGVIGMRAHLCVRSPTANAWHLLGCYRNAPLGSKSPTSITIRIADISTVPTPNTPPRSRRITTPMAHTHPRKTQWLK
ncbi:hypothetical protein BASA61_008281 [Batrachochytrium salamandrivorans]|nr:hypothetical protein BASA61_008281 [Batrachochytrium salamandrivorans]